MGWTAVPVRGVRDMTASDLDGARLDDIVFSPRQAQQLFTEMKVDKMEKVSDRETYVVRGIRQNYPPVLLYLDKDAGLLLRMVRYTDSPFGMIPTQIDYADYRNVDGVMVAFKRTITSPLDHQVIVVEKVQQNIPIDGSRFAKPQPPAVATGQGQPAR